MTTAVPALKKNDDITVTPFLMARKGRTRAVVMMERMGKVVLTGDSRWGWCRR